MYRLVVASIRTVPTLARTVGATRSLTSVTSNTTTRCYSTTIPNLKIQKANSDLSDEEINKMMDEELANMEAAEEAKTIKNWKPGYRKRPLVIAHTCVSSPDSVKAPSVSCEPLVLHSPALQF